MCSSPKQLRKDRGACVTRCNAPATLTAKDRNLSDLRAYSLVYSLKLYVEDKAGVSHWRAGFGVKTRLRSGGDAVKRQILLGRRPPCTKPGRRRDRFAGGRIAIGLSHFHRRRAR